MKEREGLENVLRRKIALSGAHQVRGLQEAQMERIADGTVTGAAGSRLFLIVPLCAFDGGIAMARVTLESLNQE